jgi:hypothetical protein
MRTFVSALEGATVTINNGNFQALSELCEEFHFRELAERLSQFRESDGFQEDGPQKDLEARKRLSALEERIQQRDCDIAALRTELSRQLRAQESASEALLGRVAGLEAEASALRSAAEGETRPALTRLQSDVARLKADFSALQLAPIPPSAQTEKSPPPTSPSPARPPAPTGTPPRPMVSPQKSAIVPDFPELFEDFKAKQFTLLWRGSRDGFGGRDFHNRCDGHPNTLTVILDTKRNIFGGFTPMEWDCSGKWKTDPRLKSFLFTLKNPHNVPARRFALKAEERHRAIFCVDNYGPDFCDIGVVDNCNANAKSWTSYFGEKYTNDTRLGGNPPRNTFFTGSERFTVKEIEVFEITT